MTLLLETAVRVSLVIVLALAVLALLRRRSAAMRHWILAAAIVCAATMPALQSVAPRWHPWFEPFRPVAMSGAARSIEVADAARPEDSHGSLRDASRSSAGRGSTSPRTSPGSLACGGRLSSSKATTQACW